MWTQRDQIQAYQFLRRRLVSAVTAADAQTAVSPSRRLVLGTTLGVVVTLLVVAVCGIVGILHPTTSSTWRQGGQVIVEQGSGARFILGQDGRLHPVLNYASARLLAGGDGSKTVSVTASTLAGAARGQTLGILGAPDSLPDSLTSGPWTACSQAPSTRPADAAPLATVLIGTHPSTGQVLGGGLLVQVPDGTVSLLVGGHRYRMVGAVARTALGYDAVSPLRVSPAFLGAVPAGRDLSVPAVLGVGAAGPRLGAGGSVVGQVLQVSTVGAPTRYYAVRADGVAEITQTEAALILAAPATRTAYGASPPKPVAVSPADLATAARSATPAADGYPATVPTPVTAAPADAVCALSDGLHDPTLTVSAALPLPTGAQPVPSAAQGPLVADQVYVAPGSGALVVAEQAPGAPPGAAYLVTDTGQKYPLVGAAPANLGFGKAGRTPLLSSVLALLPTGVTLDPATAGQVVGR